MYKGGGDTMNTKAFEIIKEEAARYFMPVKKVLSKSRRKTLVIVRKAIIERCRTELNMSMPEIADELGYADHTSVFHHLHKKAQ